MKICSHSKCFKLMGLMEKCKDCPIFNVKKEEII